MTRPQDVKLPVLGEQPISRRGMLKACGATLGLAAWAAAMRSRSEEGQGVCR